MTEVSGKNK